MGQKRRRIALSCVDCRRRKVKCDRTYPQCVRCQKGGYGDKCRYVKHTGPGVREHSSSPEDDRSRRSVSKQSWMEEANHYQASAHNAEARALDRVEDVLTNAVGRLDDVLATTTRAARGGGAPMPPRPAVTQDRRIAQIQGRLMELETMVYAAGGKPTSAEIFQGIGNPVGPGAERATNYYSDKYTLADHEKVLLRGKSFKTQYFGPSNTIAILLQFEDLSTFVRDILLAIPSLASHKLAMSKIREKEKKAAKADYDISIEALVSMVPERPFADRLLQHYLDTVETTFRILHVPTFLKDYEAFWLSPQEARPEFVVQLLVAMSTQYCVIQGGEEGYIGRSSVKRETATHWITVCSFWLESQSQKHVSLINYQLRIQLWISKWINCIKVKRFWTESGGLVRRFMEAGLHREPSLLCNKINTFDCEMRRRLWYTVLELDLQATIDRGITPTIGPMDWDTDPPRNIDDESFDMDSTSLPESKPRGEFSRTSYLAWATESLPLRIDMLQKVNSIRNTLDHDTISAYDDKIRLWMDDIPIDGWKDAVPTAADSSVISPGIQQFPTPASLPAISQATPSPLIALTYAQAIAREYLTILHQPFAADLAFKSRHFHSRVARWYACIYTILLYNPQLSQSASQQASETGLGTNSSAGISHFDPRFHLSESQRSYFASFREDYLRAALSLAHDYSVNAEISSNPFRLHVQEDGRVIHMIEAVVKMLGDRVLNLGQGFHSYWITSSALSFVHSKQSPNVPRKAFAHAAADRVVGIHKMVIDGQVARARRMMIPVEGADDLALGIRRDLPMGNDGANNNVDVRTRTEQITTMDGARNLQRRSSKRGTILPSDNSTSMGMNSMAAGNTQFDSTGMMSGNPPFTPGTSNMLPLDQQPTNIGMENDEVLQDMMFGLENMDWNMLMNADPMDFMAGPWNYPS